ncbi:MAG: hypothetical protein KDA20_02525 [Phycisphaerales bacterium]|nr:hypothetical protein [Phycisphaerales bacterium]
MAIGAGAVVLSLCGMPAFGETVERVVAPGAAEFSLGSKPAGDGAERLGGTDPWDSGLAPCINCEGGIITEFGAPVLVFGCISDDHGCAAVAFPYFTHMDAGTPICGTINGIPALGGPFPLPECVDQDWYRVFLEGGVDYLIKFEAEFDGAFVGIAGDAAIPVPVEGGAALLCEVYERLHFATVVDGCTPTMVRVRVPGPGEYGLVVRGPAGDYPVMHYSVSIESCAVTCNGDYESVPFETPNFGNCGGAGFDTTNGGCVSDMMLFDTLRLGVPLCGASGYNGVCRDSDWFLIDLPHGGVYDIQMQAEGNMEVLVATNFFTGLPFTTPEDYCPAVLVADGMAVAGCTTSSFQFEFPAAGTYVIVAQAAASESGTRYYSLLVSDTQEPCPADINEDGVINLDDLQQLLFEYGSMCP